MATTTEDKAQYDGVATSYNSYDELPMARLEAELIRTALGDCTSLRILDLGGGTGTHARQAIAAGAVLVDVADISEGMMAEGKKMEAQTGRLPDGGEIRWHVADAAKPLAEQEGASGVLGAGQYDVVMANWVFDHAGTVEDLTGMWQNIVTGLKKGGRFVGIRVIGPGIYAKHVALGTYGCKYEDIETIPNGFKCKVTLMTSPPFSFSGAALEDSYDMINNIPKELGMTDFQTVPTEDAEIVKKDPAFWKEHLDAPLFAVVTATKA